MKKQINQTTFPVITRFIFYAFFAVAFTSCRKHGGVKSDKMQASTIIYTDLNPDSAISGTDSYILDLNNDGIADFNFNGFSLSVKCDSRGRNVNGKVDGTRVTIANGSSGGIVFRLNQNYSACLDSLTLIDSSSQWSYVTNQALTIYGLSTCMTGNYPSFGNWYLTGRNQNKYMGLKFIKGSNAYYGWVRLYLDTYLRKLIVKDYAYNSNTDKPILAGQRY